MYTRKKQARNVPIFNFRSVYDNFLPINVVQQQVKALM